MPIHDARGEPITVGDPASLAPFEAALSDVLGYTGDPIGRIEAALAQDPMLVLGHLLRAHTFLFALQPSFLGKADESIARAEALAGRATPRELLHLAAAKAWRAGELTRACAAFDAVLEDHPRDLLALMFGHQADFFAGRTSALRTRPERALSAWSPDLPGFGYVQAMLAFGLEEAGAYAAAEALGREAVARNPKDVWGIHAVGHVLEMQGRDEEGIAWYGEREADWAPGCYFAVHNAWHLALYHVDREDAEAALAVYDRLIRPGPRSILLNLGDAAALLWRLHLAGVEVGGRWEEVADLMARHALARLHTFDDVHLALALAGAGRGFALAELLGSLAAVAGGEGEYARRTRLVGLPVARAAAAFAHGAYGDTVRELLAVRPHAALMTGSDAQRDVLELTLIEAALRDRQQSLAEGLLAARLRRKPRSRQIRRDLARCRKS
jgi:tetratricopeptide (TPR) repeat protein